MYNGIRIFSYHSDEMIRIDEPNEIYTLITDKGVTAFVSHSYVAGLSDFQEQADSNTGYSGI